MESAALLLLCLLILQAGCISIGPPPEQGSSGGHGAAPPDALPGGEPSGDYTSGRALRVSLSDALAGLPAAGQGGSIDIRGRTLRKVWGYGVDSSGLARTWVLGMKGGADTTMISYSEGRYRELDLPTSLPEAELEIGDLISPEELFRKNLDTIAREMNNKRVGECDLTLGGDSYEVTIRSESESTTLSFDARRGEPAVLRTPAEPSPAASPRRLGLSLLVPPGAAALSVLGFRRRV